SIHLGVPGQLTVVEVRCEGDESLGSEPVRHLADAGVETPPLLHDDHPRAAAGLRKCQVTSGLAAVAREFDARPHGSARYRSRETRLPVSPPRTLWTPPADAVTTTRLGQFMTFCEQRHERRFDGYDDLWRWSIGDGLEDMWAAVWDFFDVRASHPYERVLDARSMPGARWFEGARLNYAAHALRDGAGDAVALVGVSQSRDRIELTWDELRDQVGRVRAGLVRLGVGEGDRVAAYLPNIPETIVAFLAASSLGAIWTSCAPEFGVQAVLDRFAQV